ncbi:MAG: tetratricopeptide repeat protein [Leptolyngbya sp. SIO1E4]|nr:tetratricopeptide repeat protein [Leptolyngbya sp. SIO1E4]
MTRNYFFLAISLGICLTSLTVEPAEGAVPSHLIAQNGESLSTEEDVYRIARDITVRVFANDHTGSGTLIDHHGDTYSVLTNAHVLLAGTPFLIQTPDGSFHSAEEIEVADWIGKDVALLQFRSSDGYATAALGEIADVAVDQPVMAAGFPNNTGMFVVTTGEISFLLEQALESGYQIGYTNDVEQGMSGGPILNSQGEVIGINGRLPNPVLAPFRILESESTTAEVPYIDIENSSLGIPVTLTSESIESNIDFVSPEQKQLISSNQDLSQRDFAQAPSVDALFQQGRQSFLDFDNEAAIQTLSQVIELDSSFAEAYYYRSFTYINSDNFEAALLDLDKAISLNPDYAQAYAIRGVVLAERENYEEAFDDIERANEIEPNLFEAHLARGYVYRQQERHPESIAELSQAVAISEGHELAYFAYFNRGSSYLLLGDHALAIEDLSVAIEFAPSVPTAYALRSISKLLSTSADFIGALEDASVALELSADKEERSEIYLISGLARFASGTSYDQVLADFQKALELFEQQGTTGDSLINPVTQYQYLERSQQVERIAQEVTVRIDRYRESNGAFSGNGSGVIIASHDGTYYILTARHVVSSNNGDEASFKIITPDGTEHVALPVENNVFSEVDLAILSFRSTKSYSVVKISTHEEDILFDTAQPIFASGWPQQNQSENWPSLQFSPGRFIPEAIGFLLTQNATSFTEGYGLAYTNITRNGMSGGPLFDIEGRLIGIHGRAENFQFISEEVDFIDAANVSLGLSLGMPIDRFLQKVDELPIESEWLTVENSSPLRFRDDALSVISGFHTMRHFQQDFEESLQVGELRTSDWLNRGTLLFRASNYGSSVDAFVEAASLTSDSYEAWLGISLSHFFQGNSEAGLIAIDEAISLRPNDSQLFYLKSLFLNILGNNEAALDAINQSIKLTTLEQPSHLFKLYFVRAEILSSLGRHEESLKDQDTLIDFFETSLNYARRGYTYAVLGENTLAVDDAIRSIILEPENLLGYQVIREILANSGDEYEAVYEYTYSKLDELDDLRPLGTFLAITDNYDEAIAILAEGLNSQSADTEDALFYALLSGSYASSATNNEQAIELANLALSLDPYNTVVQVFVYLSRGIAFAQLEEYDEAISDLTQAIDLGFQNSYLHSLRGVSYLGKDDYRSAEIDAQLALSIDPTDLSARAVLAAAQSQLGQPESAIDNTDYILEQAPEAPLILALTHLARSYSFAGMGESDMAWQELEKLSEISPDFLNTENGYFLVGLIHHSAQEYQDALSSYAQALEINPDLVGALTNRGLILYELGDFESATQNLQAAIDSPSYSRLSADSPATAEPLLALAVLNYVRQQDSEGVDLLKSAVAISPEVIDLDYLENAMWGGQLIEDTRDFLESPSVQIHIGAGTR